MSFKLFIMTSEVVISIFCFLTFGLTSLTLDFLLGRLHHHLKNVDYFKLLRMNLEQQCMVCFLFAFPYHCSAVPWLTFVLTKPLSFGGHRGTWHAGGGGP